MISEAKIITKNLSFFLDFQLFIFSNSLRTKNKELELDKVFIIYRISPNADFHIVKIFKEKRKAVDFIENYEESGIRIALRPITQDVWQDRVGRCYSIVGELVN